MDVLNKTKNYFRCVGMCSELGLTREDCEIATKDKDGNPNGKVNGERIRGTVAIKTENGILTFRTYFQSHNQRPNKDGKYDNSRWKMATEMMNWNPEIGGNGSDPTVVAIEGTIDVNDYVGQDGKLKSAVQLNVSKGTTKVSADETHACTWEGVTYIKAITPETITKGDEQEETGRLVVSLLGVNGKSECFPVKAFVEEEMAEAFEDMFEVEQTVPMTIDIVSRHVGGQKSKAKRAFGGKGSVEVNSGFDVIEYMIVGADNPIEESEIEDDDGNPIDNGYINPKVMKKALKERAKKLEELESNGYQGGSIKSNSIKEQKKQFAKAKHTVRTDDEDDEDDDDLF